VSRHIPREVTDRMALELYRGGCCTPGLASRLLKEPVPEHAPDCVLVEYLRHRLPETDPVSFGEWLREADRRRREARR